MLPSVPLCLKELSMHGVRHAKMILTRRSKGSSTPGHIVIECQESWPSGEKGRAKFALKRFGNRLISSS